MHVLLSNKKINVAQAKACATQKRDHPQRAPYFQPTNCLPESFNKDLEGWRLRVAGPAREPLPAGWEIDHTQMHMIFVISTDFAHEYHE